MTKRTAQRNHAKKRAWERHGIHLGNKLRADMLAEIRAGRAKIIEWQSLRVSVREITVRDVTYRVVYDRHRKEIVTFLFPETKD